MPKPTTSADVARAAGVSRATVSYVLNERRDVKISDGVRHRVVAAARELGYQPSPAARALQSGRGNVVLILVPDWETTGEIGRFLAEVGRIVSTEGLACLRYEGPRWQGRLQQLLTVVTAAAVVTLEPLADADAVALANAQIPEVKAFFLDQPEQPRTTHIAQADIVSAQFLHLLTRGYRRVVYVAVDDARNLPFLRARIEAYESLCRAHDMAPAVAILRDDLVLMSQTLTQWTGKTDSTDRLGICSWNDQTAVGVLTCAAQMGLLVPEHLGIIGCDNTCVGTMVAPPLSSIQLNLAADANSLARTLTASLGIEPRTYADGQTPAVEAIQRGSS